MNQREANRIYDELSESLNTARKMYRHLRDTDQKDEAERVRRRARRLQAEVDELLYESSDKWIGDAKELLPQLDLMAKDADDALREIKKGAELVKNIGKALKTLDEIIRIAASIL